MPEMREILPSHKSGLGITASHQLTSWLREQNLSLACTTYQTNRLFFISGQANGRLKVHERLFDKPMGLYGLGENLYMTSRYQLWHFSNLLRNSEQYRQCDRLYVPRTAYTTGDVNAHELVVDNSQNIIFVNTDFSCLATLSPDYSFVPLWQPPFISQLVAEDRCHLNGLAMVEGKPKYVTACSTTDTAAGWRNCRTNGGVVIDIERNEIIATGLSMPHSPRWYRQKLWLLNSGTGEFGYIDKGQFVPLTFCPGFMRGLAFSGDYAVVGLSKLRSSSFTGLILEKRLEAQGNTDHCGLMVIDLTTGKIVHWLHIGQTIEELFDVVILPNVRQPEALGLQGDELQRFVTFPNSGGMMTTKPTVKRPSREEMAVPVVGLPKPEKHQQTLPIKYQKVYQLTPTNVLNYDALTYPPLSQQWQKRLPQGELFGISASLNGEMVGFVLAERISAETANVISLMVLPQWRGRGMGTQLLKYLEAELKQQGTQTLTLTYESNVLTQTALEPILKKLNWQLPQPQFGGNQANPQDGELRQTSKPIHHFVVNH